MSIVCMHCVSPPKSVVLESRAVETRVRFKGELVPTTTIRRRRKCPNCNFRWITIESVIPSSHGIDRGLFGELTNPHGVRSATTKETKTNEHRPQA